jgi:hypothetical protein
MIIETDKGVSKMKRFWYLALALLFMATLISFTANSAKAKNAATVWGNLKNGGDVNAAPLINPANEVNGMFAPVQVDKRLLGRGEIRARVDAIVPGTNPFQKPKAVSCGILDGSGNTVTTVVASSIGDQAYWFHYGSGGVTSNKVTFIAIPIFQGSPLTAIVQVFGGLQGSSTSIVTPFGVPYWGGDATSGRWILIVKSDTGDSAYCLFTVVP